MIRSSNIPPLLSKICTDGIQSSLLVTADGELLGNSENYDLDNFGQSLTAQDSADIGALVAEVVADYRRLGCELSLLDSKKNERNDFDMHEDRTNEKHPSGNIEVSAANSKGNTATMKRNPEAVDDSSTKMNADYKERGRLNCLIIELDKGLVGIASASSNNYVVALANQNVNHGMLKGRLIALADVSTLYFLVSTSATKFLFIVFDVPVNPPSFEKTNALRFSCRPLCTFVANSSGLPS